MADTVKTTLNYFSPPADGSRPYTVVDADPATGERQTNWTRLPHEVEVENLRGKEDSVTLDTAGFQFYKHESVHKSFADDALIEKEYYPESVDLIKKLTGASRAVIFDHTIRRHRPGEIDDSPQKRQPVQIVHVDQTPDSARVRVHRHLPEGDVPELLGKRYQIINLWRPILHTASDYPLALCDYRSIDFHNDLIPSTLKFKERDGETFSVKYNPNHKWKYLRDMTTEDIVLIKCFDSILNGSVAILTPHTAFIDPTTPKDAPLRESIELRALVFY